MISRIAHVLLLIALVGCYGARTPDDAGPPPRDGFRPMPDSGPPLDCRSEIVEPYSETPPCSESVNACIRRCMTTGGDGCVEMCLAAEPECQRCFYQSMIACGNEMGCQDAWGEFACCTESIPICADAGGFDRLNCAGSCMAEIEGWSTCLESVGLMSCILDTQPRCNLRFVGG